MNIEIVRKFWSTLPKDDDHPFRSGRGGRRRPNGTPTVDGDGMLHVVGFRDGAASYRNRFIRTDGFLAENQAGEPLWPGLAEPVSLAKRSAGWGARGLLKDISSTDVIVHRGKALTSFYQCGDLYRLDPYTADTLGKETWNGRFPADSGVSASEGGQPNRGTAVLQLQQERAVHALRRRRRTQTLCKLRLPERISSGTHSTWVSGEQLRRWDRVAG